MGHDSDITLPHVPGHELAGTVELVGSEVTRWKPGDRVTVPFSCGCGRCPRCLSGNAQICDYQFQPGFTSWGGFAELVVLRYADRNLVLLPDSLDFVTAASLGCRFTTAYRAVIMQGGLQPGQWMVVHGCGGVGLSAIMIAAANHARVIGVDVMPSALKMAERSGAEHVIHAGHPDALDEIHSLTSGGADVSLDALGSAVTCRNSILSLRKQGRHVQVGLLPLASERNDLPVDVVIARELELVGSHGMDSRDFPPLLEAVAGGLIHLEKLVTKTVSLDEALEELPALGHFQHAGIIVINRFC